LQNPFHRESIQSAISHCAFRIAMSSIEDDVKDAGDKMQAGAKAAGNKMADTDKDTETEYNKEKIKEKLD
jgi:hypothetical protein